ncbi:MAG TPA: hypothetical protein VK524_00360, partial [Polyangiaceae bacterium]|nr:hypothetical protein [Polyangiaceae bacterium]
MTQLGRLHGVAEFARRVPAAVRVARELRPGFAREPPANSARVRVDTMLFALAGVTPLELVVRRLLTEYQPSSLVLANHEMPVGRMLARAAEERHIPLVHVQHGIMSRHPKHAWPHSGYTCVWGAQTKTLLESLGWGSDRIVVCGPPGFDGLEARRRSASNPTSGPRVVLFTPVSGNSLTPAADVEQACSALYSALAGR